MIWIPIAVTAAFFVVAMWASSTGNDYSPASDFADGMSFLIEGLIRLLFIAVATILSLAVWLIYVLLI